ncbi:MAG TPA: hemolysin III family protein [Chthoniobacteraceae bacterium]|nr:hemolysin III family protein [Chthoniobacteraceae bacterium]
MPPASIDRPQSRGEELANSVSHGIGAVALACASPFLIVSAARHRDPALLTGVCIFAFTAMLVYLASAVYHAMPHGAPMKRVLAVIDHSAIYLMIAGTYTPFTLGVLRGGWGWTVFGVVWALAVAGVCLKIWRGVDRHKRLSLALYLGMGWLALAVIGRLWAVMPHAGFYLLVAGGVFYSAGVPFYASKITPYHHFVWHLFVLAGSVCHFMAVLSCCG